MERDSDRPALRRLLHEHRWRSRSSKERLGRSRRVAMWDVAILAVGRTRSNKKHKRTRLRRRRAVPSAAWRMLWGPPGRRATCGVTHRIPYPPPSPSPRYLRDRSGQRHDVRVISYRIEIEWALQTRQSESCFGHHGKMSR